MRGVKWELVRLLWLLLLLCHLPIWAQSQGEPPCLSVEGLEDFRLGQKPPIRSSFPGLSALQVETLERREGEVYRHQDLKFFHYGHYLGKGRLHQGVLEEITLVDPRVRYHGGFAVGSSWDEVQRVFPRVQLHYTYVMDVIFADSPQVPGLQVHFAPRDYVGKRPLEGELTDLPEQSLPAHARVRALRLFLTK